MSTNDLPPVKKNKFLLWNIAYLFTFLFMMAGGIYLFFFVRSNIARIITNTQSINILASIQNIDIIDMRAYNAANLAMKDKQTSSSVPTNLRDVFLPTPTTTPLISTPNASATNKK